MFNIGDQMDILAILQLGLPGVVFLLSFFAFRLLSKEQEKEKPSHSILKTIRVSMYINIALALIVFLASFVKPELSGVFHIEAILSGTKLEVGTAAVCSNAKYSGRYLLITDKKTMRIIQVEAKGILPCTTEEIIALNNADALKLGWKEEASSLKVEVVAAENGQKYILKEG